MFAQEPLAPLAEALRPQPIWYHMTDDSLSFTHHSHFTEILMIASLFNFFIKKIIRTEPPKQTRQPELMVFKYEGRNYAVDKTKAVGGSTNGVPDDSVQKLTMDKDGVRQMTSEWIENNLRIMVNDGEISKEAMQEIMAGLKDGATKRIYAQTDANGTTYHVIEDVMKEGKPDPKD